MAYIVLYVKHIHLQMLHACSVWFRGSVWVWIWRIMVKLFGKNTSRKRKQWLQKDQFLKIKHMAKWSLAQNCTCTCIMHLLNCQTSDVWIFDVHSGYLLLFLYLFWHCFSESEGRLHALSFSLYSFNDDRRNDADVLRFKVQFTRGKPICHG